MLTGKHNQQGGFLVEALIAMVVAGIGLFALLQSHGTMTSGVSISKARTEAMELAQKRSESLRAYITQPQFASDVSNSRTAWETAPSGENVDNAEDGVNARFFEEWMIRTAADGNYKEVMVRISWYDETQDPTATPVEFQHVSLNNFITFQDPATISGIWSDVTGESPAPPVRTRMNSAIEQVESGAESDNRETDPGDSIENTGTTQIHKRMNSLGHYEIYLGTGAGSKGNEVVLTAFGGIIHQIRGIIHFEETHIGESDLEKMLAIATSPAYCEYPVVSADGSTGCKSDLSDDCVEYICFVSGDCSNETLFSDDTTSANYDCQFGRDSDGDVVKLTDSTTPTLNDYLADIKDLGLNGGWYGKVGLFGVPDTPFDDIITGDSCEDPARFYVTHRLCIDGSCDGLTVPDICEYQRDCSFQGTVDTPYTGYVSHCEGNGASELEFIDGYCINGTVLYAIYENEGINRSEYYQHFWLIDGDLNTKSCNENKLRFSESIIDPDHIPPPNPDPTIPYLADHSVIGTLIGENDAVDALPANVIDLPETSRVGLDPPPE